MYNSQWHRMIHRLVSYSITSLTKTRMNANFNKQENVLYTLLIHFYSNKEKTNKIRCAY